MPHFVIHSKEKILHDINVILFIPFSIDGFHIVFPLGFYLPSTADPFVAIVPLIGELMVVVDSPKAVTVSFIKWVKRMFLDVLWRTTNDTSSVFGRNLVWVRSVNLVGRRWFSITFMVIRHVWINHVFKLIFLRCSSLCHNIFGSWRHRFNSGCIRRFVIITLIWALDQRWRTASGSGRTVFIRIFCSSCHGQAVMQVHKLEDLSRKVDRC